MYHLDCAFFANEGRFHEEIHIHCQPNWLIATLAKFEMTASHKAF
jgi:hypothetical protein